MSRCKWNSHLMICNSTQIHTIFYNSNIIQDNAARNLNIYLIAVRSSPSLFRFFRRSFCFSLSFCSTSQFPLVAFEICLWNLPNWRVANWNWISLLIRLDLTHSPVSLSRWLSLSHTHTLAHTLQRLQRQVAGAESFSCCRFLFSQNVSQIWQRLLAAHRKLN